MIVQAWLEEVYPAIKARATRERAVILWQDESGVRLQQLTPLSGYAPRGVKAVAKISSKHIGVNMVSALNNGGHLHFGLFEDKFTGQVFIDHFRRLIGTYRGRTTFLICDNHSTHHAEADQGTCAAEHLAEIKFVFLAAYSPHLNLDEYLNQGRRASYLRAARVAGQQALTTFVDGRAARLEIARNTASKLRTSSTPRECPCQVRRVGVQIVRFIASPSAELSEARGDTVDIASWDRTEQKVRM